MAKSELGKLVEQYCKTHDLPDLTLARLIKQENPEICKNYTVERIRKNYVLYYCGHSGVKKRSQIKTPKPLNYNTNNYRPAPVNTSAKILVLDIETAPARAYVWDIWNQNINTEQIINDWFILTWSAKWLFEDKVFSAGLTSKEAITQDDSRIVKGIWELLNKADIVIAHNGNKFDLPRMNTRFIIHGLMPPLPYQSVDTLLTVRRQFSFLSNRLDFVNQLLGLPRKTKTGQELWNKCYIGDKTALKQMLDYNVNDVRILEDTYLKLLPWIKPHPNLGLFILDENAHHCPSCGSADLKDAGKQYYTTANIYDQFRCGNCGSVGRKRVSEINIKKKRHLLLSVPK